MRLIWTSEFSQQVELRERWNALVLRMEQPEVFYTWEWAAAVARAYGASLQPFIATAHDGEELVGVAALGRSSATEALFLAGTTADYCDFVSHPDQRQEFVAAVLRDLKDAGIRSVVLANLPADSATVAAIKANKSFGSFLRTGYECAQVRLGSGEERRLLSESLLKKKMLRRSLNALKKIGPVTLRHDTGRGGLDAFCVNHVARFLATGRLSNLLMKERREFLRELAQLLSEQGWFDLMSLHVGNELVGSNYGFRFHGNWFWYQPTIVNRFENLSPGFCLLTKIVEDACQNPEVQLVDLGLGAEGYKERFANAQRTSLHATLSCRAPDLWRVRSRYYAAHAIKLQPQLESLARRAKRGAERGVQRLRDGGWTNTLTWAGQRVRHSLESTDEVQLFRWQNSAARPDPGVSLIPLSWEILSKAAMHYSEDGETLDYLLRAAQRFHSASHAGFAFLGEDGIALHFAWVAAYEGFRMAELREVLRAPSPASVMIFDCWTPRILRGQGLYGRTIRELAARLSAEDKDIWIFSAAANAASVAGIEKAGFQIQATLLKRRILWWAKTRQEPPKTRDLKQVEAISNEAMR